MTAEDSSRWPGGPRVAWAARSFALAFALDYFSIRTADPDFWGHLAIGRLIWTTGQVPRVDVFSYLPTRDWLNYEWLANVVQYPIYVGLGEPGIVLTKTLLGVATMLMAAAAARRRAGHDFAVVLTLVPAIATVALGFPPRAQIFTYFLFAVWLACLERARAGDWRWLAPLPVTMVLWTNLHAGFLAGLGLPVLYAIGQALRRQPWRPFALVFLASALAACLNPYGLKSWLILLEGTTMPRPHITEWLPVPLDLVSFPFFKLLTLGAGLTVLVRRPWEELSGLLVLAVTGALAWKVQRHMPLFALAAVVYLPAWIESLRSGGESTTRQTPLPRAVSPALAALLGLGAGISLISAIAPRGRPSLRLDTSVYQFPERAVRFIRDQGLSGNLAAEFHWGLYCAWKLYPQCKVSVDGRYETVFDPTVIAEDLDFFAGRNPGRFLARYPTDLVLTTSPPLRRWLDRSSRAELIYADQHAWLYRIKSPPT